MPLSKVAQVKANLDWRLAFLLASALLGGCGSPPEELPGDGSSSQKSSLGHIRLLNLTSKSIQARIPSQINDVTVAPQTGTSLTRVRAGEKSIGLGHGSSKEHSVSATVEGSKVTSLVVVTEGESLKTLPVFEAEYTKPTEPTLVVRVAGDTRPSRIELRQGSNVVSIETDKPQSIVQGDSTLVATFPNEKKVSLAVHAKDGGSFTAFLFGSKDHVAGACVRNDVVLIPVGDAGASK
jgi:hypothetical protein